MSLQQANLHHLKFSEISDNRDADEVVLTMEGGPYQEYFYIQIPMGDGSVGASSVVRRFVYVHGQVTILGIPSITTPAIPYIS